MRKTQFLVSGKDDGAMVQAQVELTDEQARALEALATARGTTVAALLQESVVRIVKEGDRAEMVRRALTFVGKYHSGKSDIGVEHDKYLAEDYL